jgi:hypothetical protein
LNLEELDYPFHDWTAIVTRCGRICYQRRKINLSQVFAGQKVGVKQTAEHIVKMASPRGPGRFYTLKGSSRCAA